MKFKALIIFCVLSLVVKAQDTINKPNNEIDTNKIYSVKKHFEYKNYSISNKDLSILISQYKYSQTRENLLVEYKKLKRNNRNRKVFIVLAGSVALLGIAPMAVIKGLGGDNYTVAAIGISYFCIGSLSIGISQICNYRYHKQKKHIIATYNNFK